MRKRSIAAIFVPRWGKKLCEKIADHLTSFSIIKNLLTNSFLKIFHISVVGLHSYLLAHHLIMSSTFLNGLMCHQGVSLFQCWNSKPMVVLPDRCLNAQVLLCFIFVALVWKSLTMIVLTISLQLSTVWHPYSVSTYILFSHHKTELAVYPSLDVPFNITRGRFKEDKPCQWNKYHHPWWISDSKWAPTVAIVSADQNQKYISENVRRHR